MSWQNVAVIAILLAASVGLVALDQATLAGGLITAGVSTLALFTRLGSAKDRAPVAAPAEPAPEPSEPEPAPRDVN